MKAARLYLTEDQKIKILHLYEIHGSKWKLISEQLSVNPTTAKSFVQSYLKHRTINPKMGRPKKVIQILKDAVIGAVEYDPECTLRELSELFDLSTTTIRHILNDDGIKYYSKIAITSLTEKHKQDRVFFASRFANLFYAQMPVIIFTDESYVEVNLGGTGIWRRRGEYPPGSFYEKDPHPIKCMVWGGIGPRGFRTNFVKFEGKIDALAYIQMLHNNNIYGQIVNHFGPNFIFQQDNARPHTAQLTTEYLNTYFPNRLHWPAKSPDLSPIEQLWDYMKGKIRGTRFNNSDELFNRLQMEWNSIPDNVIHSCYSSFLARCQVCVEINGESLNGHWKKVNKKHDLYRTRLHYVLDQNLKMYSIEI